MTEEYTLTVAQAAAMLGGTEKAIQRLIYTAKLDAIRIKGARGHEFRVRPAEISTRKTELQQRIAETEPAVEPTLTRDAPPEPHENVPGEAALAPADPPDIRPNRTEPPAALAARPAPLTAAVEAIPVGVYQDLFRRYDQLGRRAAKLECENRHLRHALERLQTPEVPDGVVVRRSEADDLGSRRDAKGTGDDEAARAGRGPDEPSRRSAAGSDATRGQESNGSGLTVDCDIRFPAAGAGSTCRLSQSATVTSPSPGGAKQLWRSFADRFILLGGSRPPRS